MDKNEMKLQARKAVSWAKANRDQIATVALVGAGIFVSVKLLKKVPKEVVYSNTREGLAKWAYDGVMLNGVDVVIPTTQDWVLIKNTGKPLSEISKAMVTELMTTVS